MTDHATTAYKILTAADLATLERDRSFAGSADDQRDGFIHLSTAGQLSETLARHFSGQEGLRIVAVDLAGLGSALKWEISRGGQQFPHLYAPLTLETVIAYGPLKRDADGAVKLPVAG